MGSQCCKPKEENSIHINLYKIDYVAINAIKIPEDVEEIQNIPFIIPRNPTKRFTKVAPLPRLKVTSDDALLFRFNIKEKLLVNKKSLTPDELEKSNRLIKVSRKSSYIDIPTQECDITDSITEDHKDMIIEIFYELDLWGGFNTVNIQLLLDLFIQIKAPANEELFKSGNDASLIFIIAKGTVKIKYDNEENERVMATRDYFGIEAFEENQIRTCTAITTEPTILLCLTGEMYRNMVQQIYLQDQHKIINLIKNLPVFKYLDISQVRQISDGIIQKKYNKNTIIVSEGDSLDRVYLIQEGTVQVTKSYKRIYKISPSEFFGDITLLIKTPSYYTYSVDCDDATIFEIPYRLVRDVLGKEFVKFLIHRMFINAIQRSRILFEQKTPKDLDHFFNIFKLRYYTNDETVYHNTIQKNKKICVIISGKLKKQNKLGEIVAKADDIFGEEIIDSKKDLDCNILSVYSTLTLEAPWSELLKNFNNDTIMLKENIYDTVCRLKKIPIFSSISELKLFQIAKKMNIEKLKNKQELVKNTDLEKLYIIKSGKVHVLRENEFIREMEPGSLFGEISYGKNTVNTITFTAVGDVECYILTKESFSDIDDSTLKKYLQNMLALHNINIDLNNLYYLKNLGSGKFGKVLLVHNKKNFYALKYAIVKHVCQKQNLIHYYINEKNLMLKTDHPFVLKLVKTLKNDDCIFFLLEYIDGITLKSYLDKRKKKDLNNSFEAAFYGAILLCVADYIHKKRIIHRDIKPDNCMIDRNGYLKLIDFGIAKELYDKDFTLTICGTPHYMAPEVISGEEYSFSVDYWSIGVMMFEIFYGYHPFGEGSSNVMEIYSEILNKKLAFPYEPKFKDINNFFKIILSKNIIQRICNFNHIKAHPFFSQIDFEALTDFNIKPPFIPENSIESAQMGGASVLSNKDKPLLRYFEEMLSGYNDDKPEYSHIIRREKTYLDQF